MVPSRSTHILTLNPLTLPHNISCVNDAYKDICVLIHFIFASVALSRLSVREITDADRIYNQATARHAVSRSTLDYTPAASVEDESQVAHAADNSTM